MNEICLWDKLFTTTSLILIGRTYPVNFYLGHQKMVTDHLHVLTLYPLEKEPQDPIDTNLRGPLRWPESLRIKRNIFVPVGNGIHFFPCQFIAVGKIVNFLRI